MSNNGHRKSYYQPSSRGRKSLPYQNFYNTDMNSVPSTYPQAVPFCNQTIYIQSNNQYADIPRPIPNFYQEQMHYLAPEGYNNGYQYTEPFYTNSPASNRTAETIVPNNNKVNIQDKQEELPSHFHTKSLQATAACFVPKNIEPVKILNVKIQKIDEQEQVKNQSNGARPKESHDRKSTFKKENYKKFTNKKNNGTVVHDQVYDNHNQSYNSHRRGQQSYQGSNRHEWRSSKDNRQTHNGDSRFNNDFKHYGTTNLGNPGTRGNSYEGKMQSYNRGNGRNAKGFSNKTKYNQYDYGQTSEEKCPPPRVVQSESSNKKDFNESIFFNNRESDREYSKQRTQSYKNLGHRKGAFKGKENNHISSSNDFNKNSKHPPLLSKPQRKLSSHNNTTMPILTQDDRTQRDTLIELLAQGTYECMVCCDRIKPSHALWSCNKCYNCFHLGCTKKWAGASQGEPGWRCPACQSLNKKIPSGYFCFCKKMRDPEWNRREIPHSCGEMCGKKRDNEWCTHKCTSLCHPGPCIECSAFIKRTCRCGKSSAEMKCSSADPYLCGECCGKILNCGHHKCNQKCHVDDCLPCEEVIHKECFCGIEKKDVACTMESAMENSFSCGSVCQKSLSCGEHKCDKVCHPGNCNSCDRAIDVVLTCPCSQTNLNDLCKQNNLPLRSLCTDPIPTCNNVCGKPLKCGTPGSYHTCLSICHEGPCPQCPKETAVKCRCGFMDKNIPCSELLTKADEVQCEKQCKKYRHCGKHKCGMKCCIDVDHLCTRVCGKKLTCRQHKCQEPCHRGNCSRCWETSFDELSCHCGASITYPPIPCGTEPPTCNLPCRREQRCSHSVCHTCHADPKCPPCTTLTSKPCFGEHMTMKSTPCYVNAMSCGELCAKTLMCGIHKCQKVCHNGRCIEGNKCNQKCNEKRSSCDHPCNNPCHKGPCPNTPCKEMVTVTCICGNRKTEMICDDNEKEYKSLATSQLASVMHSMTSAGSVDISQILPGNQTNKVQKFKRLECNDHCGLLERNRRLALALQITNPFSRESLGQNSLYPETMKDEAKKDISFASMVDNALKTLVLKAKESKQKNRSHSFAPMNRDKRRFIHEYAKFFSCQSQSYDEEPKKNVVVTACKLMSQLPPVSVITVIQREQGQRKVPGPVLNRKNTTNDESSLKKLEKSSSFEKKESSSGSDNANQGVIDYFDFS